MPKLSLKLRCGLNIRTGTASKGGSRSVSKQTRACLCLWCLGKTHRPHDCVTDVWFQCKFQSENTIKSICSWWTYRSHITAYLHKMPTNVCTSTWVRVSPRMLGSEKELKQVRFSLYPTLRLLSSTITSEWNIIMQFKWSFLTILYLFCIHQYPQGPTNCTAARLRFTLLFSSVFLLYSCSVSCTTRLYLVFCPFCCTCNLKVCFTPAKCCVIHSFKQFCYSVYCTVCV